MRRWCSHCATFVMAERTFDGALCCTECGRVLEDFNFSFEPTFVKDGVGQSYLSGNFVRTIQSDSSASRERTLERASEDMKNICYCLGMDEPHGIVKAASAFYWMALEKNFTRGRRTEQVEAACIYIACRESKLPYLLIDFAKLLKINIYVLGAVFLQLCKVLWLDEHHILQKPIDPTLFIHKYTTNLSGGRNNDIARTSLRIIASMRRDWMQTGRKPSGLWGAAVYVSALAHGIKCSKSDIFKLVHICEATLIMRLVEFEITESASLTIGELNAKARLEEKTPAKQPNIGLNLSGSRELLCEHEGSGVPHFAIGLCESCYNEFVEFSGGLEGGSDPPAFQRAELMANSSGGAKGGDPCSEQAAKEATAAAAREAQAANFKGGSQDLQAAQAAALAKSRKERQQKWAAEAKNAAPAQTDAEAARQMLVKKRLSSKINYDVLEKLFDEPAISGKSKKLRTEISTENDEKPSHKNSGKPEIEEDGDDEYEDGKQTYADGAHDENVS